MVKEFLKREDGISGTVITTIEKELHENNHAFFQTVGFSMEPMLHQRKSTVVLKTPEDPSALQVGDVVLFHRDDGHYVLHRIVRVKKKKDKVQYVIRGDNCTYHDLVHPDQVLGVMEGFYADEQNLYTSVEDPGYLEYVKRIRKRSVWLLWLRRLPGRVLRKVCIILIKTKRK